MSRMSHTREPMRLGAGRSPKGGKPTGTPRGMRRMVIRGEDWYWSFGSSIRIVDPEGRRHEIPITTFSGYTHHDLERAEWKGNGYDLTPRKIRDWIDRRILGYTDAGGMPAGAIPKGWTQATQNGHSFVSGPRGIWRWRMAPVTEKEGARRQGRGLPNVQIVSPEEVSTYHRVYEVTGQGVEAFFATQRASLVDCGVDLKVRVEDPIGQIMCHPLPIASRPMDRHVYDYIVNTIVATKPVEDESSEGPAA